jgi:crotonobetainyl-CoA:carnitine CoA-transferase CaiB-like acyl-CoA transferase
VIVDAQVQANGYLTTLRHPDQGVSRVVSAPRQFQRTPGAARRPAPDMGQHPELTPLEGAYTWDEITVLKEHRAML